MECIVSDTPAEPSRLRAHFPDRPRCLVNLRHQRHDPAAQCTLLFQIVVRHLHPRVDFQLQRRGVDFPSAISRT